MKKIITVVALLMTGAAMAQSAGTSETGIRYNEVFAGYSYASISANSSTANLTGYGVGGSILLEKNFIIDASYFDLSGDGISGSSSNLNLGYRAAISSNTDAIVKIGYVGSGGDSSDSSYQVSAAVGAMLTPEVQLMGQASYSGLKDSDLGYGASLGYYLTEYATIRGTVRHISGTNDMTTYTLTAGYNF